MYRTVSFYLGVCIGGFLIGVSLPLLPAFLLFVTCFILSCQNEKALARLGRGRIEGERLFHILLVFWGALLVAMLFQLTY